jgi:hypothetical protein
MIKAILFTATILCSAGTLSTVNAQKARKSDVKFLDDISVEVIPVQEVPQKQDAGSKATSEAQYVAKKSSLFLNESNNKVEAANSLQFKYALLLDTEVEEVENLQLFTAIDEWYGTRYQMGGSTKKGIDCSALTQILFQNVYGIELPRTAREQHKAAKPISRVELKEGDLVFFNTRGGVSHVGIYLQNNKFIHASSSGGVTISDLFEEYWMRRFIGVGRIETTSLATASLSLKP